MLAALKPTPVVKPLLNKDLEGLPRKYDWSYRSVIGMCGYLQGSTQPDISMATHQFARYNIDPKLSHEHAIRRIGKYLLGTQNKGIIFSPNPKQGLECFVDADFSGIGPQLIQKILRMSFLEPDTSYFMQDAQFTG